MTGIGLLVPDLLCEIMFALPSSIDQKFAFTQVSRHWRNLALDTHLFWSSFTGGNSTVDCYRLPLLLERSGSSTMLHIQFRFGYPIQWPRKALNALVPYVARIETLEVEFTTPMSAEALLNSALEFPALRKLRLQSSSYRNIPHLSLTAPQLRTLDIERIDLTNWAALLSPSLESVELWGATRDILLGILKRCPRVARLVLQSWDQWYNNDTEDPFEVLTSRPLAPALRELELQLYEDSDLDRVLKTAFSDVVLHSLTGCRYNGHSEDDVELLAGALLRGMGSLVFFKLVDMHDLELHDEAGHIRHLQCWNDDSSFQAKDAWKVLSMHHGLHKTVREIQIRPEHWHEYLEMFESYPPLLQEGITLTIETSWGEFPQIQDDEGNFVQASKILGMPGLSKVKFCEENSSLFQTILDVLALIEPPAVRQVEVCIELATGAQDVLRSALPGSSWTICSHCVERGTSVRIEESV